MAAISSEAGMVAVMMPTCMRKTGTVASHFTSAPSSMWPASGVVAADMPCTDMNSACASASTATLRRCGTAVAAAWGMDRSGCGTCQVCIAAPGGAGNCGLAALRRIRPAVNAFAGAMWPRMGGEAGPLRAAADL
jgi:hypothetical protein